MGAEEEIIQCSETGGDLLVRKVTLVGLAESPHASKVREFWSSVGGEIALNNPDTLPQSFIRSSVITFVAVSEDGARLLGQFLMNAHTECWNICYQNVQFWQ
jgi:hypothetical protein